MNARLIVAVALVSWVAGTQAQQGKAPRVGVLHGGNSKEAPSIQREPFEQGLREQGWIPGSSVQIDYRYAEGDPNRLAPLAAELVRSGVDVIVARGNTAIDAARKATSTIPIVMSAWAGDPVSSGLAKSLSRPGGNITGVRVFAELDSKRLELLKETFPATLRVGVIGNPDFGRGEFAQQMEWLRASARLLKLEVQVFELRRPPDIDIVFAEIARTKLDALLVRGDPIVMDPSRNQIVERIAKRRLPAIYWWPFFVEAGGLMSYGERFSAFHRGAAGYVSRILRGAKPGELPIEQPQEFDLAVNLKTAKQLGLEIPNLVLLRATRVIE